MVGYADDLAIVVRSSSIPELEAAADATIEAVSAWMAQRGLSLAPQKTKAVMWRKRRYHDLPTITVDGQAVSPSRGIKYLGVRLNSNRSFMTHVEEAASRAESVARAVARLMPNTGGPSLTKRKMLMTVAASRLLYAAPVWASGPTMTGRMSGVLARINRLASLRVIRAYRTVSSDAAAFLASSIPLDLLARERVQLWAAKFKDSSAEDRARRAEESRAETLSL